MWSGGSAGVLHRLRGSGMPTGGAVRRAQGNPNKQVNAFSEILDDGGEAPTRFVCDFRNHLPDPMIPPSAPYPKTSEQRNHSHPDQPLTPVTYYARPYAENSAGETIGPLKKIGIEEEFDPPSTPVLGATEWFESPGSNLHRGNDNWIFHAGVGWIVANKAGFGQWFWNDAYGWCWTQDTVFPSSGATGPTTGCTSWPSATTTAPSGTSPPRWRKCPDRRDRSKPEPEFLTYSLRLDFRLQPCFQFQVSREIGLGGGGSSS